MLKNLKVFTAGLIVGTMCAGVAAYATVGTKTIEVEYDNIKVYKDNVLCELKDANGSTVEPFIYNGTTYLPVRGVANAAGMGVTWDGATSSVYLWDELTAGGTYLLDVCEPYSTNGYESYAPQSGKSFQMAGTKYSNGFTLNGGEDYALFNLNGKYSNIEFTIGHVDDTYGGYPDDEWDVYFYVDGNLVKTVSVGCEELPKTVSIPVNYGLQLKILRGDGYNSTDIGFANVTVK